MPATMAAASDEYTMGSMSGTHVYGTCPKCGGKIEVDLDTDGHGRVIEIPRECRSCVAPSSQAKALWAKELRREGRRPRRTRIYRRGRMVAGLRIPKYGGKWWFHPYGQGGIQMEETVFEEAVLLLLEGETCQSVAGRIGSTTPTVSRLRKELIAIRGEKIETRRRRRRAKA